MSAQQAPSTCSTTGSKLLLALAALSLTFPQFASASYELVMPPNSPWKDEIAVLVAKAMADARAREMAEVSASGSATESGFAIARKTAAIRLAVESTTSAAVASSTSLASSLTSSGTPPILDQVMAKIGVLTHEKIALIAGCAVALFLLLGLGLWWCCGSRKSNSDESRPPTPFADRATSLPSKRRRSYKTLEG